MGTIGAYEAKTHLSELLDRVEKGERITITRNGHPAAVLQFVRPAGSRDLDEVIAALKALRAGRRLAPGELRAMIEEGRR